MARKEVYHEKQEAGLCGVHCLNTLLQGHYFGPEDLAEIGRSFDENERRLMMEMGETKDFLRFMAEDSGNVADDGFFSVQVGHLIIFHTNSRYTNRSQSLFLTNGGSECCIKNLQFEPNSHQYCSRGKCKTKSFVSSIRRY